LQRSAEAGKYQFLFRRGRVLRRHERRQSQRGDCRAGPIEKIPSVLFHFFFLLSLVSLSPVISSGD
jgi:hypothetical protein